MVCGDILLPQLHSSSVRLPCSAIAGQQVQQVSALTAVREPRLLMDSGELFGNGMSVKQVSSSRDDYFDRLQASYLFSLLPSLHSMCMFRS